jgi:alkanesulfonate monooxygenase SsuD/methylene tetrahydromethanopterin reductase-like flavin-dependent oxidoreductase (luciferase family)
VELGIQVVGSYDHVAQVAGICERAGIAAVALADHYLYGRAREDWAAPAYDSFVQAAALARDTSDIEIVMLVSPITFRHPAVYAKGLTTIDEISGGRFVFGLGTGWHRGEHEVFGFEFPSLSNRFEWLEDALGYLRAYVDDPAAGYRGVRWSLEGLDIHPRTRADLRLMVGGGGEEKTPTLVGRYADEYNLYHHTREGVEARLEVMRRAAEAAGRDPDAIKITTCVQTIAGADAAEVDEFLADFARARGWTPERLRALLGDSVTIRTWDQVAAHLDDLEQMGFERVYLQAVGAVAWSVENALSALA